MKYQLCWMTRLQEALLPRSNLHCYLLIPTLQFLPLFMKLSLAILEDFLIHLLILTYEKELSYF